MADGRWCTNCRHFIRPMTKCVDAGCDAITKAKWEQIGEPVEKEKTFAELLEIPGALIGKAVKYYNGKCIVYGDMRLIHPDYKYLALTEQYNDEISGNYIIEKITEWIEPAPVVVKPKVKMAQALIKFTYNNSVYIPAQVFKDEKEIRDYYGQAIILEFPFNGKWIEVDE